MELQKSLSSRESLVISSMLFGLFFGAGNIIIPIQMGNLAGSQWLWATMGFLVTAVGLPLLAVTSMGLSQTPDLFHMAQRVSRPYAYLLVTVLYLTIGPLIAIPRLATVSFEVGFASMDSIASNKIVLLLYSLCFYAYAYYLACRPKGIVNTIGRWLNPLFLCLLGFVLAKVFLTEGFPNLHLPVSGAYINHPFLTGFLEGYVTLDAAAGLAFGVIIIAAIRNFRVSNGQKIALGILKAGVISMILMALVYVCLTAFGVVGLKAGLSASNGGELLAKLTTQHFGLFGNLLLFTIVFLACLKTTIGLIVACAETFFEIYPGKLSFKQWAALVSISSFVVANFGLNSILIWAKPFLMFIYPLCIVIILLHLIPAWLDAKIIHRWVTGFTLFAAIFDFLGALPVQNAPHLVQFANDYLPGYRYGLGWVLPSMIGLICGLCHYYFLMIHRTNEGVGK